MQSPLSRTPPARHLGAFSLRIKEPARNDAISLSVALKRPDRSFGAIADSRASSFTVGVGSHVHFSSLHIGMTEPKRDLSEIFGGL